MGKILLSTVAVISITSFAPAFAADKMPILRGESQIKLADDKVIAEIDGTKSIVKGLVYDFTLEGHGKNIPSDASNVAYVDQVGTGNSNSQTQSGNKNVSVVSQKDETNILDNIYKGTGYNEAIVVQTGTGIERNVSFVEQGGSKNEARVTQSGSGNKAQISQDGNKNGWSEAVGLTSSEQSQTGHNNEAYAIADGARNNSIQRQDGDANRSSLTQRSRQYIDGRYANVAHLYQDFGGNNHNNDAVTFQRGDGNFALVDQSGTGHFSSQHQNGSGNGITGYTFSIMAVGAETGAYISQRGTDQTAAQYQIGNYNLASIDQMDADSTNNVAAQFQFGSYNKARVTQTGSHNLGLQVQNGTNHTAILMQSGAGSNVSTQYQTGSNNYSSTTQDGSSNHSTVTQSN